MLDPGHYPARQNGDADRQHNSMRLAAQLTRTLLCILSVSAVSLGAFTSESFGDEAWDVEFDGVDSAADNVPNFLRWDSPIDDDWEQPGGSYQLNTPSPGFMSVDRATNPADHHKTGNIWIRDPILSHAEGFTMEVGVQLGANSNLDAFAMTYLDFVGSFGVHLSPGQIKAGDLAATGPGVTTPFDTTDAFHTYRIVKQPNSFDISVYVDGDTTPIITGAGNTRFRAGISDYRLYPRVLIGDNSNDPSLNANYVLDFVRYRRGATPPGVTPPAFPPRELPPLPPPAPANETWTLGYDGVGLPSAGGWTQAGSNNAWTQQPDGIMEFNSLNFVSNARMDGTAGWTNLAAVTIETRIKVLPDSEERGFTLVANDQAGDITLVLSPDKAELQTSYKPVGHATITMDTTDDFHVYRLTREAEGLYWHLYIDDNPVAAIEHQHAGGTLLSFSRIYFGDINFPIPENGAHVLIDYIRWHEGANSPQFTPLLGDANNDGQVTGADLIAVQQNFGNTGPADGTLLGDANDDGQVTGADLISVQQNFGNVQSDAQGPGTPEPGTLNGLLLSALIVCQRRRHGTRRQKDHL